MTELTFFVLTEHGVTTIEPESLTDALRLAQVMALRGHVPVWETGETVVGMSQLPSSYDGS